MRIYKALNTEVLHNKTFHMGDIILQLDNKVIFVCNKFNHSRKQKLELLVWLPSKNKWVRTYAKNKYTEAMWDYYRKTGFSVFPDGLRHLPRPEIKTADASMAKRRAGCLLFR